MEFRGTHFEPKCEANPAQFYGILSSAPLFYSFRSTFDRVKPHWLIVLQTGIFFIVKLYEFSHASMFPYSERNPFKYGANAFKPFAEKFEFHSKPTLRSRVLNTKRKTMSHKFVRSF